jgi:zinc transporter ZupT
MAMDAKQWHILSICLFPCITLCGIFLAAFLGGSNTTNKLAFSMGVMFSSGVLLAAALVHALPESQQLFEASLRQSSGHHAEVKQNVRFLQEEEEDDDEQEGHGFPWASTIFGSCFLLLMCIEAMTERFIDRYIGKEVAGNLHHHVAHIHGHHEDGVKGGIEQGQDTSLQLVAVKEQHREQGSPEEVQVTLTGQESQSESSPRNETPNQRARVSTPDMVSAGSAVVHQTTFNETHARTTGGGYEESDTATEGEIVNSQISASLRRSSLLNLHSPRLRSTSIKSGIAVADGGAGHTSNPDDSYVDSTFLVTAKCPSVMGVMQVNDIQEVDEKQTINPWVAVLLLIVLSIHVLIEGIVLGSTKTVQVIESTFIAIVFHKGFSAFALGSSLVTSGYWDKERPGGRRMFYILAYMYATVDIIGIGTGMRLSSSFDEESYVNAVLQALLGGSFLFVATAELMPGELEKMRVFQFPVVLILIPLLLGYALMTFIGIWT